MPQTLEEIRAAYPREWVLIADYEEDEAGWVLSGTVLAHSPHRRDVYIKLAELAEHPRLAVQYTGPVPQDQLYLL